MNIVSIIEKQLIIILHESVALNNNEFHKYFNTKHKISSYKLDPIFKLSNLSELDS